MNTTENRIELSDRELHELYDQMLDDCYEPVKIAGCEYGVSTALKNVDPIAYRCGFNDWLDSECQEGVIVEENNKYFRGEK